MFMRSPGHSQELSALSIDAIHRERLQWFLDHEGQIVPYGFIARVQDPYLTSTPKGIYKPAGWEYSLSVKETLNSPYGDIPIATLANGDWVYRYHREDGDDKYTNRGLLRCLQDGVPVGVLIQVAPKPKVEYFVAGLGRITGFQDPWFDLVNWRSIETNVSISKMVAEAQTTYDVGIYQSTLPGLIADACADQFSDQLVRPNQQMFRVMLLSSYNKHCAISETNVINTLEAAHIRPYSYDRIDSVRNGLLLRADVHRLFDSGLLGVDSSNMEAVLSPKLIGTEYESYQGKQLNLPADERLHPSHEFLEEHRKTWNLS